MHQRQSECDRNVFAEAEARGRAAADNLMAEFQTADVILLARHVGAVIRYERWPPVTIGECEPRSMTIRVNLSALEHDTCNNVLTERAIIAHELGHLIDARRECHVSRSPAQRLIDEHFARAFAAQLLGMTTVELDALAERVRVESRRGWIVFDVNALIPPIDFVNRYD